jgi:presenilin-like A22 family membrane protease
VIFLAGGRSETIRGLRGDGRDERFCQLDVRATAFAGTAAIVGILVGFMVDVARGGNGEPYVWLGAVAGVAYVGAIVYQRVRG